MRSWHGQLGQQSTVNGQSITATYDAQDRLINYGSATYTFDPNGAVTSTTDSSGTITYNYNSFGNLTSFTQQDGAQWQILRDYNGNRVGVNFFETPESITIRDNQNRALATLTASGSLESSYVYGIKSNAPDYMVLNGVIYKLISDQIGSMRLAVSTTDGSILERIDYDEFGNVLNDTNRGAQNFGFAGSYSPQPGAGFLRIVFLGFNERHYDPLTGRWNRQDPIGFAGGDSNLYGYVLQDPINFIDPTGLAIPPDLTDPSTANGEGTSHQGPQQQTQTAADLQCQGIDQTVKPHTTDEYKQWLQKLIDAEKQRQQLPQQPHPLRIIPIPRTRGPN